MARLRKAKRPVLVLGGQVLLSSPTREQAEELAKAIAAIGAPVYLAGGARGLLGPGHPLQLRHKRREALREADLVLLAGIPNDFRLDYGRHVSRKAFLISVNRSEQDLRMNRKPDLGVLADPGLLLREMAEILSEENRPARLARRPCEPATTSAKRRSTARPRSPANGSTRSISAARSTASSPPRA